MAMKLKVGDPAPGFTLTAHHGAPVSLADFRGRRLLLWFYPEAGTPGCTLEGRSFRDQIEYFNENNIVVAGVSFDPAERIAEFAARENFPFLLLCDRDRTVALAYGACESEKAAHAARMSFLIGPSGSIERIYPQVDPRDHAAQVLIDALGL
jgi:peroxiredoxin Q/BCP